jgi:hypothetical protein
MNTREASIAVRNVQANPEVVVLIENERGPVTRIRGGAEFTKDGRVRRRAAFRAALKYLVSLAVALANSCQRSAACRREGVTTRNAPASRA